MTLTRDDAALALREIAAAGTHSRQLLNYTKASPHLLLWGALWLAVGVMTELTPGNAGWTWLVVDAIGFSASLYFIVRDARSAAGSGAASSGAATPAASGLRYGGLVAVAIGFFVAVSMVFGPTSGAQFMSLAALMVSAVYIGVGLWVGARYAILGVVLGVLTLIGFFILPAHAISFISAAGGITLLLGGFWMRSA
ncbi:MAG: hypothetical protein JNK21_13735 [Rhodospirillaceae bacterium]|nr:hypothetical protein [Rhodospirillaceae bacterium]